MGYRAGADQVNEILVVNVTPGVECLLQVDLIHVGINIFFVVSKFVFYV